MDQLSREKAEALITDENVRRTKLEQDRVELRVFMELTDGRICLVKYNKAKKSKTYFLKEKSPF